MGAKSSKTADVFITEDVTYTKLTGNELSIYEGNSCEYVALDVSLYLPDEDKNSKAISVSKVLTDAHKKNFSVCFLTAKEYGRTENFGRKRILTEEEEREYASVKFWNETTHTVILCRPKLSNSIKQSSLERMEAQKTLLGMMFERNKISVKFYIRELIKNSWDIEEIIDDLQKIIIEESSRGSQLQSVVKLNRDNECVAHIKLLFIKTADKNTAVAEYLFQRVSVPYTEKKLKINKKKHPVCKSKRAFNTYCTYKWLDLFRKKHKIVEVIYFERPKVDSSITRNKNKKKKGFEVVSLWIYEKPLVGNPHFHGLVREVWNPVNKTLHEVIRKEAVSLGEEGWQLATVLPTHQVRMNYDGSDHKKHIFFFQRQYSIKYSGNSCSESSFAKWIENKRQDPSVPTVTQEHLDKKSLCDLPDSVLAEGQLTYKEENPDCSKNFPATMINLQDFIAADDVCSDYDMMTSSSSSSSSICASVNYDDRNLLVSQIAEMVVLGEYASGQVAPHSEEGERVSLIEESDKRNSINSDKDQRNASLQEYVEKIDSGISEVLKKESKHQELQSEFNEVLDHKVPVYRSEDVESVTSSSSDDNYFDEVIKDEICSQRRFTIAGESVNKSCLSSDNEVGDDKSNINLNDKFCKVNSSSKTIETCDDENENSLVTSYSVNCKNESLNLNKTCSDLNLISPEENENLLFQSSSKFTNRISSDGRMLSSKLQILSQTSSCSNSVSKSSSCQSESNWISIDSDDQTEENEFEAEEDQASVEENEFEVKDSEFETKRNDLKLKESHLETDENSLNSQDNQFETEVDQFIIGKNTLDVEDCQIKTEDYHYETAESQSETGENQFESEKSQVKSEESESNIEENSHEPKDNQFIIGENIELEDYQIETTESQYETEENDFESEDNTLEAKDSQLEAKENDQKLKESQLEIDENSLDSQRNQLKLEKSELETEKNSHGSEENQFKVGESTLEVKDYQVKTEDYHFETAESQFVSEENHLEAEENYQYEEEENCSGLFQCTESTTNDYHQMEDNLNLYEFEDTSIDESTPCLTCYGRIDQANYTTTISRSHSIQSLSDQSQVSNDLNQSYSSYYSAFGEESPSPNFSEENIDSTLANEDDLNTDEKCTSFQTADCYTTTGVSNRFSSPTPETGEPTTADLTPQVLYNKHLTNLQQSEVCSIDSFEMNERLVETEIELEEFEKAEIDMERQYSADNRDSTQEFVENEQEIGLMELGNNSNNDFNQFTERGSPQNLNENFNYSNEVNTS